MQKLLPDIAKIVTSKMTEKYYQLKIKTKNLTS